jgi:hypothetical protein
MVQSSHPLQQSETAQPIATDPPEPSPAARSGGSRDIARPTHLHPSLVKKTY